MRTRDEFASRLLPRGTADLGSRGGRATPSGWAITAGIADDDLVARHEAHHDRVLFETPFGVVQSMIWRASELSEDAIARSTLGLWRDCLFDHSIDVHEAAATYCSIKSFPQEMHDRLLQTHPDDYLVFYHRLSDVVDSSFHSSYLQYLVAKTIVELCFAPPLAIRLAELDTIGTPDLQDDESPKSRYQRLVSHFSQSAWDELNDILGDTATRAAGKLGLPTAFDVQNEDHWCDLRPAKAIELDTLLDEKTTEWMYVAAADVMPCLSRSRWHISIIRFSEWLTRQSGVPFEVKPAASSEGQMVFADVVQRGRRSSRAVVDNPDAHDTRNIPVVSLDQDTIAKILTLSAPRFAVTMSGNNQNADSLQWLYVSGKPGTTATVARLTNRGFRQIVEARNQLAMATGFAPTFEATVIGVGDIQVFQSIYDDLHPLFLVPTERGTMSVDSNRVVWYMSGDLRSWIDQLVQHPGVQMMPVVTRPFRGSLADYLRKHSHSVRETSDLFQLAQQDLDSMPAGTMRDQEARSQGFQAIVIRVPKAFGLFLRWCAAEAATQMASWLASYGWKVVPENEREELGELTLASFPLIRSFWTSF